jgi:hypothetical protein
MKKNSTIQKFQKVKFCVSLFVLLFLGLNAMAQTTVFEDNFTRTSPTSVSDGGTPSMTYTTTIGAGSGQAAYINANYLYLKGTTGTTGNLYVSGETSKFNSIFNNVLSSNAGTVEWTFNTRYVTAAQPTGLADGNWGFAVVLAGTNAAFHNAGNGYAIVYGSALNPEPIRLVRYTDGLQGTLTDIINTSSVINNIDATADYASVRVKYIPSTNSWTLYVRDDNTEAYLATPVPDTNQYGTTVVDNTYTTTGNTMTNFGFFWCHGISSLASSARFDNFKVTVDVQTLSNNADLTSLSVDEKANNSFVPLMMFNATTYNYDYYLVKGNPIPVISGVVSHASATTAITQATSLTGTDAEKTAKIEVTAQDGTTKKTYSVKFIETENVFVSGLYTSNANAAPTNWKATRMYFANSTAAGNNKFEGGNYARCISTSTSSELRLPETKSVGTLRFYAKKYDPLVVGNFKVSTKINAGEWTVVQDLGDISNTAYQEFSVVVNQTATDSMFVRIEITKNGDTFSSAGYYIDDISYTAASPNAVINPLSDFKINMLANKVIVSGALNKSLLVVTMNGQTVISRKVNNDSEIITLPTGFYVLSIGNERYKIRIVKN